MCELDNLCVNNSRVKGKGLVNVSYFNIPSPGPLNSGSNVVVSSVFVVATTYDMVTSFLHFNDVIDRRAVGVGRFLSFSWPGTKYVIAFSNNGENNQRKSRSGQRFTNILSAKKILGLRTS